MLKICGDSIRVQLEMIFKQAVLTGMFLYFRYVVKYLKDLILTKFLSIFPLINLSRKTESGFQPPDSCINQLLSITHEISTSFDNGV